MKTSKNRPENPYFMPQFVVFSNKITLELRDEAQDRADEGDH